MTRKTLVEKDMGSLEGGIWLVKLVELVKERKSFEEESLMYGYEGADKEEIWTCMEFFYQNLYNQAFGDFVWHDDDDEWENYNFTLKYRDLYSEVNIVYGIGSFCVIKPVDRPDGRAGKVFDLERIALLATGEVIYNDD